MRRRSVQRAFTLIEIMVVMVIIGILVAGAILSLGATGKDRGLEQERDRLAALVPYVRERAAILTLEYGIRCGEHGYRFVYYDNLTEQWLPETTDDTLKARRLPDGMEFQLVIEGRPVVLDDKALVINPVQKTPPGGTLSTLGSGVGDLMAQRADNNPQIMLLSNGDTNSFSLTLARPSAKRSATIASNDDGSGTIKVSDIIEARQ